MVNDSVTYLVYLSAVIAKNLTFIITDGLESLDVVYKGTMPNNFGDQTQVVIEGKLDSSGEFQASSIMTKCPSKYEAEE